MTLVFHNPNRHPPIDWPDLVSVRRGIGRTGDLTRKVFVNVTLANGLSITRMTWPRLVTLELRPRFSE